MLVDLLINLSLRSKLEQEKDSLYILTAFFPLPQMFHILKNFYLTGYGKQKS